jgi:hypothetical protein
MSSIGCAAALLVSTCTASAALADPPTGTRLGDWRQSGPSLSASDQARGAEDLARCLYKEQTPLARGLLLARDPRQASLVGSKLMGELNCHDAQFANDMVEERRVEFQNDILRGMLAEAALQHSRDAEKALPALPLQRVYQRDWFVVTGRNASVDEMGACIADTNPSGISDLLAASPMSKDEDVAFAALSPSLGKCLRAGTKLTASRQALRAALADAIYQRMNAADADLPTAPVAAGTP